MRGRQAESRDFTGSGRTSSNPVQKRGEFSILRPSPPPSFSLAGLWVGWAQPCSLIGCVGNLSGNDAARVATGEEVEGFFLVPPPLATDWLTLAVMSKQPERCPRKRERSIGHSRGRSGGAGKSRRALYCRETCADGNPEMRVVGAEGRLLHFRSPHQVTSCEDRRLPVYSAET